MWWVHCDVYNCKFQTERGCEVVKGGPEEGLNLEMRKSKEEVLNKCCERSRGGAAAAAAVAAATSASSPYSIPKGVKATLSKEDGIPCWSGP